jgi:hypothetical protein
MSNGNLSFSPVSLGSKHANNLQHCAQHESLVYARARATTRIDDKRILAMLASFSHLHHTNASLNNCTTHIHIDNSMHTTTARHQ